MIALHAASKKGISFYKNKRHFMYIVLSGIGMGLSWVFLFEAYKQIGVSIASLEYSCGPVIVMILSPLLFGESMTVRKVLGFVVVAAGVVLVSVQPEEHALGVWGLFCGAMSAVMYSAMVIFNKKAESITGTENSAIQMTVSFLSVALFMLIKRSGIPQVTASDIVPVLTLGLVNTGLGCYLYFSSIGGLPVQKVAVFGYLELLSAVIFSFIFLDEALSPLQIAGAVFIIGGAAAGEGIRLRKRDAESVS